MAGRVNDADIGLMRNDKIDIFLLYPRVADGFFQAVAHSPYREFVNLPAIHPYSGTLASQLIFGAGILPVGNDQAIQVPFCMQIYR